MAYFGRYEEDVSSEDVSSEDVSSEDVSSEDVSTEDVSSEDVSTEDVSSEDVSTEDVSTEDVSSADDDNDDDSSEGDSSADDSCHDDDDESSEDDDDDGDDEVELWTEECLPHFKENILMSHDQPCNGKIYIMFHGTNLAAAKKIIRKGFKQSEGGMLGTGVYVSRDIYKAARYPLGDQSDQVILKLRVNVGRVKKIEHQKHPLKKSWHDKGYDTAWVPAYCGMVKSQLEEDCIWDPKRIKVVGIAKAPKKHVRFLKRLVEICRK